VGSITASVISSLERTRDCAWDSAEGAVVLAAEQQSDDHTCTSSCTCTRLFDECTQRGTSAHAPSMRRVGSYAAGDARVREHAGAAVAMVGDDRAKAGAAAQSFVPSCGTSVVPGWEEDIRVEQGSPRGVGPTALTTSEQMASSMIGAVLTSLMVTPFDVV
jgi:hypothetical protein